jgi:uncharacterized protein with LGFP repeats
MSQAESHKSSTRARTITVWALCSFAWSALVIFPLFSAAAIQHKVYGAIAEKWSQLKGETGPLGAAKTNEATAARGGRFNEFAHGFIYWHPKFGAHAVYGDIGVKWNQLGRERGFGYPLTDELPAPDGGRYNDFENGGAIYWHRKTGAHAVYGEIRKKWLSVGGVGRCGYPKTDEYLDGRHRRTDFERGYIRWSKQTGATLTDCVIFDHGPELIPVPN